MNPAALIQRAADAGVVLRLEGDQIKYSGTARAVRPLLEPLRQHKADLVRWFRQTPANAPEQSTDPCVWRELAQEYHLHHFNCKACCAGGQGRGLRCGVGASLWRSYLDAKSWLTPGAKVLPGQKKHLGGRRREISHFSKFQL